jgi:hypothetical protein
MIEKSLKYEVLMLKKLQNGIYYGEFFELDFYNLLTPMILQQKILIPNFHRCRIMRQLNNFKRSLEDIKFTIIKNLIMTRH